MLPIAKTPIERPTIQVPSEPDNAVGDVEAGSAAPAAGHSGVPNSGITPLPPAMTTVFVKECGLCAARTDNESWSANPPERPEEEENWVTILETKVHSSCLAQAIAEKLVVQIQLVERTEQAKNGVEDHREFATHCLEPQEKVPLLCVVDKNYPIYQCDVAELSKQYGQTEVPVTAIRPFSTGFKIFPQTAPPRTLEDLLQCTSKLNKGGRFAESSLPLDIRLRFPEVYTELRKSIPVFTMPGGPCDVLWKDPRNRTRTSSVKMVIHSPGSVLRVQRSRFRAANLLLTSNSQIEWAGMNYDDSEKILEASKDLRSNREDPCWIPDLAFCLRRGARVYCGQQTQPGQMILTFPGALYWGFVREESMSTILAQWSFAERSRLAFEYALMDPLCATHPEELSEVDLEDAREDVLNLKLFQEILRVDDERLGLLPKDLAEALVSRLVKACQDTPVDAVRSAQSTAAPDDHAKKVRCDECRAELFDRRVYCSDCESEGQDMSRVIELAASHPPRPSSKKDRSTLPDWLRVGCRVLVNLTVSGNSNDKPPRVVGASHLPAIILKTGHGFFTVYLEGAADQVVKRKAAIEPHPAGPQLARGYSVRIRAEGGGNSEPHIQTTLFRACIFCPDCYTRTHQSRAHHNKRSAVYLDGRQDYVKQFEQWKKEILNRSAIRKDDLCVWNSKAPMLGEDDVVPDAPLAPCAVLLRTVSLEAGQSAIHAAQVMGPSPYHYPTVVSPSLAANSPMGGAMGGGIGTRSSTAQLQQQQNGGGQGMANLALGGGGMERRTRTAARKRMFGEGAMSTSSTSGTSLRASEATKSSWTSRKDDHGIMNTPSFSSTSVTSRTGNHHITPHAKRSRSGSSGGGFHQSSFQDRDYSNDNDLYLPGAMESHLLHAGLSGQTNVGLSLQNSSFFVGGQKSLSILLEADAVVHAYAEMLDSNKHEEIKEIWARARREVPLRKVWKFFSLESSSPQQSSASSTTTAAGGFNQSSSMGESEPSSKRAAIDTLAESAAAAEPAPEVA